MSAGDDPWRPRGCTGEAPCSTRSPRISSSGRVALGLDRDPRVARVDPPDADLALADLERPAHLKDAIEDLGQEQRVDDVPADLDFLDRAIAAARGAQRSRSRNCVARHGSRPSPGTCVEILPPSSYEKRGCPGIRGTRPGPGGVGQSGEGLARVRDRACASDPCYRFDGLTGSRAGKRSPRPAARRAGRSGRGRRGGGRRGSSPPRVGS